MDLDYHVSFDELYYNNCEHPFALNHNLNINKNENRNSIDEIYFYLALNVNMYFYVDFDNVDLVDNFVDL